MTKIAIEAEVGYLLEVDLEYPINLHNEHNGHTLAQINEVLPQCTEKRLLLILDNKQHSYVLHYRILKFYLKHQVKNSKDP